MKMKYFYILLFSISVESSYSQEHIIQKIWETSPLLKTPESVLFYPEGGYLLVSNIDGEPDKKDGKGFIAKLDLEGNIIKKDWITNLNAPKGMRIYKQTLYVTDLNEIIGIDIPTGKVIKHIPITGALFLNDIAIDSKGILYVSDTRTGKVHKIKKEKISVFIENLKRPNGLLATEQGIYLLNNGGLYHVDQYGHPILLVSGMDESTDGIEQISPDEFIVSSWSGIVYFIKLNGDKQVLLDQREQNINSADIGYNPTSRIIYIPTFFSNTVAAYQLK